MRTFKWAKYPNQWESHSKGSKSDRFCLIAGMWKSGQYYCDTLHKIRDAIQKLFPNRATPQFANIVKFNDHPDTTVDDVNKVCEMAGLDLRFEE